MRIIFVLISLLFLQHDHDTDKILWDVDKKLKWSDFQGTPPTNSGFVKAITAYQILIESAARYEDEIPHYDVKNVFVKSDSWTKTISEKTLVHEQLHFDISELYARKVRQKFNKLYQDSIIDTSIYKKVFKELDEECYEIQKEYDREAHFNNKKQQEWQKCIAKELEEMKEYEYVLKE